MGLGVNPVGTGLWVDGGGWERGSGGNHRPTRAEVFQYFNTQYPPPLNQSTWVLFDPGDVICLDP